MKFQDKTMNSACHKNNHTMQKFFSLSGFAEEEKRDLGRDSKKIKFLEISNKALSPARPPPLPYCKNNKQAQICAEGCEGNNFTQIL